MNTAHQHVLPKATAQARRSLGWLTKRPMLAKGLGGGCRAAATAGSSFNRKRRKLRITSKAHVPLKPSAAQAPKRYCRKTPSEGPAVHAIALNRIFRGSERTRSRLWM